MKKILRNYRYAIFIVAYAIVYMAFFAYLEHRTEVTYHILYNSIDNYIPFCEYFIIPYLLWFPYMITVVFYFVVINRNPTECRRLLFTLCTGMTIFLIFSFFYPNGLQLRPKHFVRDNIFTQMVAALYRTDTPTNVLPSIHVFNSIAIYMAIAHCKALKKHNIFRMTTLILTVLIILSTMFLKQHSIVDVIASTVLSFFLYPIAYKKKEETKQLQQIKSL